jgi:hypothetical protein
MKMATLFVPFANAASRPINMRVGNVKVEPPPAFTLMNPAIAPTPNKRAKCARFMSICNQPASYSSFLKNSTLPI